MSLPYPLLDPIALEIGPLVIRWYSLAYVGGILLGWWYALKLLPKFSGITKKQVDDFIVWLTLGILLGGRIGYVIFYTPHLFWEAPLDVFKVWQGGMSFHGGLAGVIIALVLYCRNQKISLLSMSDLAACVTPIGLFLGRIANFINGELYGRPTDLPWGMVFPRGGEIARHPSQLYEALLEGIVLFLILWIMANRSKLPQRPGALSAIFLIFYAAARFFVEFFREPDAHLGFVLSFLSMGQLLSLFMMSLGLVVIYVTTRRKA